VNEEHYQLVRRQYEKARGDHTELFETILALAEEIGLDEALSDLERCVTEKRLAWLGENLGTVARSGDPLDDAYTIFYHVYLGLSTPQDGEIIQRTDTTLVTRWWNHCPTLEVCQKLGLDTREICRKVQHEPVQSFLAQIDPRLKFDRNYDCIRPHTPYCEETIRLLEECSPD
jgi:hypothetical protein